MTKTEIYRQTLQESKDKDIRWVMKENLKKNRLIKTDADWVNHCLEKLG